ncbi:MAG: hypothetical protein B6A08_19385 [Sorangiineae bacterium NIC37A_2]|jgi:PBP1b-binding outer membrane lipoprotein LpoB|nr:MAG: hypothetical protein B6A08_19385 [Sorangiineae bacterium NIC37A_2]
MNDKMLRSMKWLASALVLAMVAGGCKKSEPPPEPEKKVEKKAEKKDKKPKERPIPLPRVSPEEPRTEVSEYPVPDEFADEAVKSVSLDHLEAELDSIEAEILGGG